MESRVQVKKEVQENARETSSCGKTGKSRANGSDFSTFTMKYKAKSLLRMMKEALVRGKEETGRGNSHAAQRKNAKRYHRSTQSPSRTQRLTGEEVKKEELHVQLKRVAQIKIREETTGR